MPRLVDHRGLLVTDDLARRHADVGFAKGAGERGEPARLGFGVVIEKCDEVPPGGGDPLIIGGAKAAVLRIPYDPDPEFGLCHVCRAVAGTVVHQDGLKVSVILPCERLKAGPEQLPAVPVDYDDRHQASMLAGAETLRTNSHSVSKHV
jgi:hypothetical protein